MKAKGFGQADFKLPNLEVGCTRFHGEEAVLLCRGASRVST